MFTPQFHSFGPHSFNPKYVWKYYGLILAFDPVAVDATGLRIIEAIRREYFGDDRPLNPPAKHIAVADTKYHLGTADPAKKSSWSRSATTRKRSSRSRRFGGRWSRYLTRTSASGSRSF